MGGNTLNVEEKKIDIIEDKRNPLDWLDVDTQQGLRIRPVNETSSASGKWGDQMDVIFP